jgi:transposase-like protein
MERIPTSERTREKLRALMEGRSEVADGRSELVRLAARLIIEEALEGEAGDALGRDHYARGAAPGAGYRNGYRTGWGEERGGCHRLQCAADRRPSEPFRSRIRAVMRGRTEELEALAVEMYARGLSTRDIEALFADKNGASLLSRTIEECLPRSLRQRCLAHKMRNLQSKVPEDLWPEYKARSTACYKAPSAALARLLRDDIAAT